MATTTEAQKQKAASDKIYFLKMVEHHKKEAEHYAQKARDCDPFELVSAASPGDFAGL
jgi:hypothetical protein